MSDSNNDIDQLKNSLLNKIYSAVAILGGLIVSALFIRDYPDDIGINFVVQFLLYLVFVVITLFKEQVSAKYKVYYIAFIILTILLIAIPRLGFLATAKFYIVLIPVLISFQFSLKKSILFFFAYISVYAYYGFTFITGKNHVQVDATTFITDKNAWITEILVIVAVTLSLMYIGNTYLKAIIKNLQLAQDHNRQLLQSELELKEHKANLENIVQKKTESLDIVIKELKDSNKKLSEKNNIINQKNTELNKAIEDIKNTQAQLIQSEKMVAVGMLTAGVAHEINNPLNFIVAGTSGLERELEKLSIRNDSISECLHAIQTGTKRATSIVSGMNQLSRNTEDFNEKCGLFHTMDNCLLILNSYIRDRITVRRDYVHNELYILGNSGKLHQVFLNILTNAVQAIAQEGEIRIITEKVEGKIHITIRDNGCGIAQENIEKVTTPFYTTKPPGEGTGLGLSISYSIIKAHKGQLKITSKKGVGTDVEIKLPRLNICD